MQKVFGEFRGTAICMTEFHNPPPLFFSASSAFSSKSEDLRLCDISAMLQNPAFTQTFSTLPDDSVVALQAACGPLSKRRRPVGQCATVWCLPTLKEFLQNSTGNLRTALRV